MSSSIDSNSIKMGNQVASINQSLDTLNSLGSEDEVNNCSASENEMSLHSQIRKDKENEKLNLEKKSNDTVSENVELLNTSHTTSKESNATDDDSDFHLFIDESSEVDSQKSISPSSQASSSSKTNGLCNVTSHANSNGKVETESNSHEIISNAVKRKSDLIKIITENYIPAKVLDNVTSSKDLITENFNDAKRTKKDNTTEPVMSVNNSNISQTKKNQPVKNVSSVLKRDEHNILNAESTGSIHLSKSIKSNTNNNCEATISENKNSHVGQKSKKVSDENISKINSAIKENSISRLCTAPIDRGKNIALKANNKPISRINQLSEIIHHSRDGKREKIKIITIPFNSMPQNPEKSREKFLHEKEKSDILNNKIKENETTKKNKLLCSKESEVAVLSNNSHKKQLNAENPAHSSTLEVKSKLCLSLQKTEKYGDGNKCYKIVSSSTSYKHNEIEEKSKKTPEKPESEKHKETSEIKSIICRNNNFTNVKGKCVTLKISDMKKDKKNSEMISSSDKNDIKKKVMSPKKRQLTADKIIAKIFKHKHNHRNGHNLNFSSESENVKNGRKHSSSSTNSSSESNCSSPKKLKMCLLDNINTSASKQHNFISEDYASNKTESKNKSGTNTNISFPTGSAIVSTLNKTKNSDINHYTTKSVMEDKLQSTVVQNESSNKNGDELSIKKDIKVTSDVSNKICDKNMSSIDLKKQNNDINHVHESCTKQSLKNLEQINSKLKDSSSYKQFEDSHEKIIPHTKQTCKGSDQVPSSHPFNVTTIPTTVPEVEKEKNERAILFSGNEKHSKSDVKINCATTPNSNYIAVIKSDSVSNTSKVIKQQSSELSKKSSVPIIDNGARKKISNCENQKIICLPLNPDNMNSINETKRNLNRIINNNVITHCSQVLSGNRNESNKFNSTPPSTFDRPKVVVEKVPSLVGNSLADVSALKDSDENDSDISEIDDDDDDKSDPTFHLNNENKEHRRRFRYSCDKEPLKKRTRNILRNREPKSLEESDDDDDEDFNVPSFDKDEVKSSHNLKIRLKDIPCIVREFENCSLEILSIFHMVLFNSTGSCRNKSLLHQTRNNILRFSGFSFEKNSNAHYRVKQHLQRLHFQILNDMKEILIGNSPAATRQETIEKIIKFLMEPSKEAAENYRRKKHFGKKGIEDELFLEIEKYKHLKQDVLNGKSPKPKLRLVRLTPEEIAKYTYTPKASHATIKELLTKCTEEMEKSLSEKEQLKLNTEIDSSEQELSSPYGTYRHSPGSGYCVSGSRCSGRSLQSFPEIARDVSKANEEIITLIHILLFGKDGDFDTRRQNILNFSGFLHNEKYDFKNRKKFLRMISHTDLNKVCDVLHLKFSGNEKEDIITGLLQFIKVPCESFLRNFQSKKVASDSSSSQKRNSVSSTDTQPCTPINITLDSCEESSKESHSRSTTPITKTAMGKPLKSFETIRFKIECATPDDLLELYDLLFIKACDNEQIHQHILQFSGFTFDASSNDYHFRKMLLTYMSFDKIEKIAKLLDLISDESNLHKNLVADRILKFLMEPKEIQPKSFSSQLPSSKTHIVRLESKTNHLSSNLKVKEEILDNNSPSPVQSSSYLNLSNHQSVRRINSSATIEQQMILSSSSDDEVDSNVPLLAFVNHPSDSRLKRDIREIIHTKQLSLTMKELVNEVYAKYPEFDIRYRSSFIKSKARHILSNMQGT